MVQGPHRTSARIVRGLTNVKLGVLINYFLKGHAVQQCIAETLDADRNQKETEDEEKGCLLSLSQSLVNRTRQFSKAYPESYHRIRLGTTSMPFTSLQYAPLSTILILFFQGLGGVLQEPFP